MAESQKVEKLPLENMKQFYSEKLFNYHQEYNNNPSIRIGSFFNKAHNANMLFAFKATDTLLRKSFTS